MLKDVVWAEDGTYKPNGNHQPLEFFTAGLKNSTQFDLQLGYFNSAALSVLSYSFASFISSPSKRFIALSYSPFSTYNLISAIVFSRSI